MTTQLDTEFRDLAAELVAEFSTTSAVFHVHQGEDRDPTTDEITQIIDPVSVLVSPLLAFAEELINGKTILAGDARIFLPTKGLTFTPQQDMRVDLHGEWRVVRVSPRYSGDDIAVYELQLRSAA